MTLSDVDIEQRTWRQYEYHSWQENILFIIDPTDFIPVERWGFRVHMKTALDCIHPSQPHHRQTMSLWTVTTVHTCTGNGKIQRKPPSFLPLIRNADVEEGRWLPSDPTLLEHANPHLSP